ncbi:MAG: Plug domain-containing protein [Fibrobacteres bacterium]|nr:Plug domain-containing protein [Fibrobacterota bacterium]
MNPRLPVAEALEATALLIFLAASSLFSQNDSLIPAPYTRNGSSFVISKEYISSVSPSSFGDLLDPLPGGDVARLSYGGTLSDYKFTGHELFLDDRPLALEVDGMLLRGASADRVYFNRLPLQNIDSVRVTDGGGLGGSAQRISVYTRDDFRNLPVTRVLWETGPFKWNAVQFAFSRKLSASSGLSLSVQKNFQAEQSSTYSNRPDSYEHPEAIVDIYRVLLGRKEGEYVSDGLILSNDFSRWDLQLNFVPAGLINVCASYEYMTDEQMDVRSSLSVSSLNLSSKRLLNRVSLRIRPLTLGRVVWNVKLYNEKGILKFPKSPTIGINSAHYDGQESGGFGLAADVKTFFGKVNTSLTIEAANDLVSYDSLEFSVSRTLMKPELSGSIPAALVNCGWILSADIRTDERNSAGKYIPFASPKLDLSFLVAGIPVVLNGSAAIENRYPAPDVSLLPNKRMNLRLMDDTLEVISSKKLQGGVVLKLGKFSTDYHFQYVNTDNPAVMKPLNDVGGIYWNYSQNVLAYERKLGHFLSLSYRSKHLYHMFGGEFVNYLWKRVSAADSNFNTFSFVSESRLSGRFVENRLGANGSFILRLKPAVWAIDPWTTAQPYTLGWHISADMNLNFTVKTFRFYTKFENLGNYLIQFEPGYYLPGPSVRWGIDWTFGG